MHAAIMFAIVLIFVVGTDVPVGTPTPGEVPVDILANSLARLNAAANALALPVDDPSVVGELINGASAFTAATVVTSLIFRNGVFVRFLHVPRAAIRASAALFVPAARPGFPPVATR